MSYSIFRILYPKFSINPQEVRVFSTSLEKIMCATRRKSVFFRTRRVFNLDYVSIKNPASRTEKSHFSYLVAQITISDLVSHLHPAARQFCRSTYTITDNTIK
jgi:hypothetical protein